MSGIDRNGLRNRFWETVPLSKLTQKKWEALCDGCGKCCLNKLEDADTGQVELTCISCRLLDGDTCLCTSYENRRDYVPECISLTPKNIDKHAYWMPRTCAYRLLWQRKPLPEWHPLITGDPQSVHAAGVSVLGKTVNELTVDDDDWEDHIIEEPT